MRWNRPRRREIRIRDAVLIGHVLQEAIDAGSGGAYFPVIAKHLG